MKTALYLRVSTDDQNLTSQRAELRRVCELRGWKDVVEYRDVISGSKVGRAGLDAMMKDLRAGKVGRIVCYKLDRLGRSLAHLVQLIGEMDACKVALVCTSQGIDTSADNPAGRFQLNILAAVAEFERSLIRERTKVGMKAAKARGAAIGRPSGPPKGAIEEVAAKLKACPEMTLKDLAETMGVSTGTAHAWKKMALAAIEEGKQ